MTANRPGQGQSYMGEAFELVLMGLFMILAGSLMIVASPFMLLYVVGSIAVDRIQSWNCLGPYRNLRQK